MVWFWIGVLALRATQAGVSITEPIDYIILGNRYINFAAG
jgi:hypothetical protein